MATLALTEGDAAERRRAKARERGRRFRERQRGADSVTPPPEPTPSVAVDGPRTDAPRPVEGFFTERSTRPLSELKGPPSAYTFVPPPLVGVSGLDTSGAPVDSAGAARAAVVVAGLFKMALARAAKRYELEEAVAGLASMFAPGEKALTWDRAEAAAVGFVYSSAERAAAKHGITAPALPYQDELVAIGAVVGSVGYLVADVRGMLPERKSKVAPPPAPDDDAEVVADAEGGDGVPVRSVIRPTANGQGVPRWMGQ